MELALGTVQFGLAYGVAGRQEAVPPAEAHAILARAHALGIRTLDTAAAYGDIEERLAGLCGDLDFDIVSKVPALPAGLSAVDAARWAVEQADRSRSRLGPRLKWLMLHRADDLQGDTGQALWSALAEWGDRHGVAVGASCYEPAALAGLRALPGFAVTQLPGNALDQRVRRELEPDPKLAVHLRSAFLQGLLLMDPLEAARKLPAASAPLARWHAWCRETDTPPLRAALSVVRGFAPAVQACVVGVDRQAHLEEIAQAWAACAPAAAPDLHCDLPEVVDPRLWKPQP